MSDKRKPQYGDIAALFANQKNKANVGVKRKSVYNGLHNILCFLIVANEMRIVLHVVSSGSKCS